MKTLAIGLITVSLSVMGCASRNVRIGACCATHHDAHIPLTIANAVDWGAFAVSLSDSEIEHFRKRAKALINDRSLWERLGEKYEGPFEVGSESFQYACERLLHHKATIAVTVPIKRRLGWHSCYVTIVFRQYFKDNLKAEVESIRLGVWL